MIEHDIKAICPYCGRKHDCATEVGEHFLSFRPTDGDWSVCVACHKVSVFTRDLGLRKPTSDESLDITQNVQVLEAQIRLSGT
jgi:hypothetical protein